MNKQRFYNLIGRNLLQERLIAQNYQHFQFRINGYTNLTSSKS